MKNWGDVKLLGTVKEKSEDGITIAIAELERPEGPLPTRKTHEAINALLNSARGYGKAKGNAIEACCDYSDDVVSTHDLFHPLFAATHLAFHDHRPLVLSPDIIWLAIAQGVALHVNQNAEILRKRFVAHEGKEKIIVRRDDFMRLSPENPWQDVFSAFTEKIKGFIGDDNYGLMVQKFSTTTPVDQAAFEVTLMDGMQSYFSYEFQTMCGIPEVTLNGKPDDWRKILTVLDRIATFDLAWWVDIIRPTIQKLLDSSEGKIDAGFWNNIYKLGGGSGGPYASGWMLQLMPYVYQDYKKVYSRNPVLNEEAIKRSFGGGLTTSQYTSGLACAPFQWVFPAAEFSYEFISGFVGIKQDKNTMALTPKIGWAVRERAEKAKE